MAVRCLGRASSSGTMPFEEESETGSTPMELLHIPNHVASQILGHLDVYSLCATARTCPQLFHLCSQVKTPQLTNDFICKIIPSRSVELR